MTGERALALVMDPIGSVARGVRTASSYLATLFARFSSKIKSLGAVAVALGGAGCEGKSDAKVTPPAVAHVVEAPVAETPEVRDASVPGPIGSFDVTFYYVTTEEEVAATIARQEAKAANDNAEIALASVMPEPAPREIVPLYEMRTCAVLAEVDKAFAKAIAMQGTGKLKDGRLLNVAARSNCDCERKPCFHVVEGQTWGTAGTGRPLAPFRTVAVDPAIIKLGSLLYVPLLDGRTMPGRPPWGGFVHDGCVVADDTGGGIKGHQIDLFVGRKGYFLGLSGSGGSHAWARHVEVFDGSDRCERKGRRIGRASGAI